MSHNTKEVAFRFINSYIGMDGDEEHYFRQLDSKKSIIHVYSCVAINEGKIHGLFNELFVPTKLLQEALDECLSQVGGSYVSVSFRFIGLLGDFKDTMEWHGGLALTPEQREDYVGHGLKAIERVYRMLGAGERKVLVTSDSGLFIERAKAFPFVYVIPGPTGHIDDASQKPNEVYMKTFLDFLMISKADRCYHYSYGHMFEGSKFSKTAALVGGKQIISLTD